jgi:hypothetical protein
LHAAALYLPWCHVVLGTEPVGLGTWVGSVALSMTVFVAVEAHKGWYRYVRGRPADCPPTVGAPARL